MKNVFRRMVPFLFALAFSFGLSVVSEARADAPSVMYQYSYGGYTGKWGATYDAACANLYATRGTAWGANVSFKITTAGGTICGLYNGTQYLVGMSPSTGMGCADGSNPDTTKPTGSQCAAAIPAPNCAQDAGKTLSGDQYTVVSPTQIAYGLTVCVPVSGTSGGCAVSAVSRTGTMNLQTGKWEYIYWGPLKAVGSVCSGNGTGASDPVKDQPTKCDAAAGMCTGLVNGVEVCVKCAQTDSANTKTNTTTNPDGSTTQTTTNTNTTINNNSVTTNTTTTTVTTPAGGGTPTTQTKTDSTTEDKDSYCQRNSNAAVCKEESKSSFGGTCDTSFVCEGDAVQCAMAREQYKRNCEIEKSPFAESMRIRAEGVVWEAPQDEIDAINLNGAKNIKVDEKFQLNMTAVAQKLTTAGGATCPTGQGVDFFANHVEISYEIPCRFATVIRAFVTLAAAFVAFRIFAAG